MDEKKNAELDALAGKLKTGDMSKSELFGQLSALYDVTPDPELENGPAEPSESGETSDQKRERIEALLDNFKASLDAEGDLFGEEGGLGGGGSAADAGIDPDSIQLSSQRVLKQLRDTMNADADFGEGEVSDALYGDDGAVRTGDESGAGSSRRFGATGPVPFSSNGPRSRDARIKELETVMMQNQQKACTFKPEIKPLPNMYVQRDVARTPLVDRLYAWQSRKKRARSMKKLIKRKQEREECTFKPRLNPNSKNLSSGARRDIRNVSLRSQARAKVVEREIRRQVEQETVESCTFKPKINEMSRVLANRGRDLDQYYAHRGDASARVLSEIMRECTFKPKIKGVRKGMQAANLYLETAAHERLSQPVRRYTNEEAWPAEYGEDVGARARASSTKKSKRPSVSSPSFLRRSKAHLERKKSTVQQHLQREAMELYRPRLNKKSVKMVKQSFLTRLKKDQARRKRKESQLKEQAALEVQSLPFRPAINTISKNLRARTFDEMSEGDVALKNSKIELARMYARKKELDGVTFKPERKTRNKKWDARANSTLRIASEPHNYVERIQQKMQRKTMKLERKRSQLEEWELQDCTFAPDTKELPDFVRRIADSVKAAKAGKPKEQPRPGWR